MPTANGTRSGNDRLALVRDRALRAVSMPVTVPRAPLSQAARVQEVGRDKVIKCGQMRLRPPREMRCLGLKRFRISRARSVA